MTRQKGFVAGFADFFADVRAARHCASAIEAGRKYVDAASRMLQAKAV